MFLFYAYCGYALDIINSYKRIKSNMFFVINYICILCVKFVRLLTTHEEINNLNKKINYAEFRFRVYT